MTTPNVQITVVVSAKVDSWVDTHRDQAPILGIEIGQTEICLVLADETVTHDDVDTTRRLAAVMKQYADQVAARHAAQQDHDEAEGVR